MTRASRDVHYGRQHERDDSNRVHEKGHSRRQQHDAEKQSDLAIASKPHDLPAQPARHPRLIKPRAQHENRADRDHHRTAEASHRLVWCHQTTQGQSQKHEKCDEIDAQTLRQKQQHGEQDDSENQQDGGGHGRRE